MPRHASLFVLLALAPAPALAAAPPLTAEEAIERERTWLHGGADALCPSDGASGDIVVCGRSGPGQRMEFPREEGEIVRHAGEPVPAGEALAGAGCTRLCTVGVRVNVVNLVTRAPAAIRRLLGKD
ncbi:MAG: hypothetical protein JOZ90_06580 [Alphaproteobacteria bacterium]|nr:hypothetical protein [Alphaproteobacteria bacterium]MBV9370073.1 hypothetical protein [Alphaproteobacteria bacterium]MBV9900747.1 hypothetical protein [Alphaproteobacteria bacterium]